jgi:hypothetical protein
LDSLPQLELEAAAFRRLLAHLRDHPEIQNIDLMITADFCRNCLAKWLSEAAQERGLPVDEMTAKEWVYGEPYDSWKGKHQRPATPAQLEALSQRKPAGNRS